METKTPERHPLQRDGGRDPHTIGYKRPRPEERSTVQDREILDPPLSRSDPSLSLVSTVHHFDFYDSLHRRVRRPRSRPTPPTLSSETSQRNDDLLPVTPLLRPTPVEPPNLFRHRRGSVGAGRRGSERGRGPSEVLSQDLIDRRCKSSGPVRLRPRRTKTH